MKRISTKFILYIEVILLLGVPLLCLIFNKLSRQQVPPDSIVDYAILALFLLMVVFRNAHPRHFFYTFLSLILAIAFNIAGVGTLVFFFSSLAAGTLVLAVLNLLCFNRDQLGG